MIILCLVPLSACSGGTGAAIRYDITSAVSSLDPQFAYSEDAKLLIRGAFEGLFTFDSDGSAIPAAAESYTFSSDGLTCTVTLREGLVWSDNSPLTADDFVFGISRLFHADFPSGFASDFACILNAREILEGRKPLSALGLRADGERNVVFTLEYPAPQLPQLLCSTAAMPCKRAFFEETRGRYGLDEDMLIYNGPFYVRYWEKEEKDKYVQLRRNPVYRDVKAVMPDRVTFYVKPLSERFTRFKAGKTDAALLGYDEWSTLGKQKYNSEKFEDTVWVLLFNQKAPFLENTHARRALAACVNHSDFAPILGNDLVDSNTFLPPTLRVYDKGYRVLAGFSRPETYQPEQALSDYRAAQAAVGKDQQPLTLLVPQDSSHPLAAGSLQKSWQQNLALPVNIQQLPQDRLMELVENGNYQMAVVPLHPSSPRPETMLGEFASDAGRNLAHYSSAQYDTLLARCAAARSQEELLQAILAAEQKLYDDAVLAPLYFQTSYYVTARSVSGIYFSPFAGEVSFKSAVKK